MRRKQKSRPAVASPSTGRKEEQPSTESEQPLPPPDQPLAPSRARRVIPWAVAALIVLIVSLCYRGTLDFPMVFDDRIYLISNPLMKDSRSFAYPVHFQEFANAAAKQNLDPDLSVSLILRPLSYLTFHINYILDGENPRWYRAFNLVIHGFNGWLVFVLVNLLLRRPREYSASTCTHGTTFIAAATALLFTAHPLATESVTYIVQRFTSLSALVYLATLIFHLMANAAEEKFQKRFYRICSVLACVAGMLTKECMFTAPLLAIAIDALAWRTPWRQALKRGWLLLLTLPILPSLVLLTTWAQHQGTLTLHDVFHLANVKDVENPQEHYFITQITVLLHYLKMVLWPSGQNIDPEWPTYTSLLDPHVLMALFTLAALTGGLWWWQKQNKDARLRLAFAGVLWFFITISVSSGIFPLPDMMAEHRTYLPSLGILLAAVCLLDCVKTRWITRIQYRWAFQIAVFLFIGGFAKATMERNEIWSSRIHLWQDATAKAPDKHRVWVNLGAAYASDNKLQESIDCFQKAILLMPTAPTAYSHLSTVYCRLGMHREALDVCVAATKANSKFNNHIQLCYNAAIAHLGLGNLREGELLLKDLSDQIPNHQLAHLTLSKLYEFQKRMDKARLHLLRASLIGPLGQEDVAKLAAWDHLQTGTSSR